MGDPAAAQVQAPAPPATQPAPAAGLQLGGRAARGERRMAAIAKVQSSAPVETVAPAPAPAAAAPKTELDPAKPADPAPEKPDPATDRGLRTIEQARKKFLDEQNAAKAELDVQRAEIARLRKEAEGKVGSAKELEGLKPKDLISRFAHYTSDDWHAVSRLSYALTEDGKKDPRAAAAASDAERALGSRAYETKVAELEQKYETKIAELEQKFSGEFTRRDQASFASRWLEDATKAIPADKPSFISKLHANDPDGARRELLTIGQELEKANDGEPPTHAEVIAEFEKRKIAMLKSLGIDPDSQLAPPKPAEPAKPAGARTLNVAAPSLTRAENAPKTREERRAGAIAKIRATARTADQT